VIANHPLAYFALNVTQFADALVESASDVKRFPGSLRALAIERYVFDPDLLGDLEVFKIPQRPKPDVYVTDKFLLTVEEHRLRGFALRELWRA